MRPVYVSGVISVSDISLIPLPGPFGVEVRGVNIAAGLESVDFSALASALMTHKVLLLRDQRLTTQAYAEFARAWGPTRIDGFTEMNVPGFEDVSTVGNTGHLLDQDAYRNGASFWHTDCAAEPDPNATTMLYCIHAPARDGETVIADMQAAYDALDPATRREIADLLAYHCYSGTREVLGGRETWEHELVPVTEQTKSQIPSGALRPIVRRHSVTGRKGLYSPAGSMVSIDGMAASESHRLMRKLKLHAIDQRFCYRHRYRVNDLLMWDNTATMHYATPIGHATSDDERRLLYRIVPLGLPSALSV